MVQFSLAVLDTAALYLISTVFSRGNDQSSVRIETGIGTVSAIIALFTLRSVLSTFSTWQTMRTLAQEEVAIGHQNFQLFIDNPAVRLLGFDLNDLFNVVDRGPGALVSGLLLSSYTIISEVITGSLILVTLVFLQPVTALTATGFFVLVAYAQHKMLSGRSATAGQLVVKDTQRVYDTLADVYMLGKVLAAMPSTSLSGFMRSSREKLTFSRTKSSFLSTLPRYFMELVLAFGLALVALTTYLTGDTSEAVKGITVFAAAGFRLLPIVNRIQGLVLQVLTTLPSAALVSHPALSLKPAALSEPHVEDSVLEFDKVSFSYTDPVVHALTDVSFQLKLGRQYAIIGPSGAGKTTLVDLALGLLIPTAGEVRRSAGVEIGYVPQDTHVAKLTLDQNIALEWSPEMVSPEDAERSIEEAELRLVQESRLSFDSLGATNLSGGQKQRVGLARAFYRKPTLLFLDEVTSALDAETESLVMKSVHSLRGNTTVVIIAHRLSTVKHADEVIYVDNGQIVGIGSFDQLRAELPQLQRQIDLGTLDLDD
jgi:ABC-type multidrug transport system fused ATPase/permease subunit